MLSEFNRKSAPKNSGNKSVSGSKFPGSSRAWHKKLTPGRPAGKNFKPSDSRFRPTDQTLGSNELIAAPRRQTERKVLAEIQPERNRRNGYTKQNEYQSKRRYNNAAEHSVKVTFLGGLNEIG